MTNCELLGTGKGIFDFCVKGEVLHVDNPFLCNENMQDKIIITKSPSPAIYLLMKECKGVVSENGSLVSHLAIIGMDMNVPVIVGVSSIYDEVKDGDIVVMKSINERGEIYAT